MNRQPRRTLTYEWDTQRGKTSCHPVASCHRSPGCCSAKPLPRRSAYEGDLLLKTCVNLRRIHRREETAYKSSRLARKGLLLRQIIHKVAAGCCSENLQCRESPGQDVEIPPTDPSIRLTHPTNSGCMEKNVAATRRSACRDAPDCASIGQTPYDRDDQSRQGISMRSDHCTWIIRGRLQRALKRSRSAVR